MNRDILPKKNSMQLNQVYVITKLLSAISASGKWKHSIKQRRSFPAPWNALESQYFKLKETPNVRTIQYWVYA